MFEGGADKLAPLGAAGELHPDAAGLMVPPGHIEHVERTLVTESESAPFNSAVVHETGITEWSPRNEDWPPTDHVVDYFRRIENSNGVGVDLTAHLHRHDHLRGAQIGL